MAIKITYTNTQTNQIIDEDLLTDEEVDALLTDVELAEHKNPITDKITKGIIGWIANMTHNKARKCIDDIVTKSGKGSKFTPVPDKIKIIQDLKSKGSKLLKTAKQRQIEFEAKMK